MAKLQFKTHPKVPDSLWHDALVNCSSTATECTKNPGQAEYVAQMALDAAEKLVAMKLLEHYPARTAQWAQWAQWAPEV